MKVVQGTKIAIALSLLLAPTAQADWNLRRGLNGFGKIFADAGGYPGLRACIEVRNKNPKNDQKLVLGDCNGSGNGWRFENGMFHSELDDDQCMQAGRDGPVKDGEKVRMFKCDSRNNLQQFEFGPETNTEIRPKSASDLCVTWRGVTPNIDEDPMIFKRCSKVEDRNTWSQD